MCNRRVKMMLGGMALTLVISIMPMGSNANAADLKAADTAATADDMHQTDIMDDDLAESGESVGDDAEKSDQVGNISGSELIPDESGQLDNSTQESGSDKPDKELDDSEQEEVPEEDGDKTGSSGDEDVPDEGEETEPVYKLVDGRLQINGLRIGKVIMPRTRLVGDITHQPSFVGETFGQPLGISQRAAGIVADIHNQPVAESEIVQNFA